MNLSAQRRARIRRRAQQACEYCHLPQRASILPHQIDHIIAQQHLGADDENNLCLCCLRCNLKKGPNIASIDPAVESESGELLILSLPWRTGMKARMVRG